MSGPLQGITILDLTHHMQGPMATAILADLGADVIKVEHPVKGDGSRGLHLKNPDDFDGVIAFYEVLNRSKRSITLDLTHAEGRGVFYRLVKSADVVTSNFTVGTVERLGVDYETLVQYNPRIITAAATGWGTEGPDAEQPCLDISGQARSGFANLLGDCAGEMFHAGVYGLFDAVGAMMFGFAISIAIANREREGVGQHVEVSQLASAMMLQTFPLGAHLIHGETPPPFRVANSTPLYSMLECSDGRWIALASANFSRAWAGFSTAVGVEHLKDRKDFLQYGERTPLSGDLMEEVRNAVRALPSAELLEKLRANGCFAVLVQNYDELRSDPQVVANDYLVEVEHPSGRRLTEIGLPMKFSRTPGRVRAAAPEFGQHTEEFLLQHGFDWAEITRLRDDKVL